METYDQHGHVNLVSEGDVEEEAPLTMAQSHELGLLQLISDGLETDSGNNGSISKLEKLVIGPKKPNDKIAHGIQEDERDKKIDQVGSPLTRLKRAAMPLSLNRMILWENPVPVHTPSREMVKPENPFLNDVVVMNLAKYFNFSSLKSARLVCSKWNQSMVPAFQRKAMIVADFDQALHLEDFVGTFPVTKTKGHAFQIQSFLVRKPGLLDSGLLRSWISKHGKEIKHLEILSEFWDTPFYKHIHSEARALTAIEIKDYSLDYKDLMDILTEWCPNLNELIIRNPLIKCDRIAIVRPLPNLRRLRKRHMIHLNYLEIGGSNCQIMGSVTALADKTLPTLLAVFDIISSVKTLKLACGCDGCDAGLKETIERINGNEACCPSSIFENIQEMDLRELYSLDTLQLDTVVYLASLQLKSMKKLLLGPFYKTKHALMSPLICLLHNLSFELEELEFGTQACFPFPAKLLYFSKLKKLVVKNTLFWGQQQQIVENMDFVLQAPQLEVLTIYKPTSVCIVATEIMHPPFDTTAFFDGNMLVRLEKHLCLRELNFRCDSEDLRVIEGIVCCFPNLETLRINFEGKNLAEALSLLSTHQKITTLKIHLSRYTENIDKIIIQGVPKFKRLKKIAFEMDYSLSRILGITDPNEKLFIPVGIEAFSKGFFKVRDSLKEIELCRFEIAVETLQLLREWEEASLKNIKSPGNEIKVKLVGCKIVPKLRYSKLNFMKFFCLFGFRYLLGLV